MNGKPNSMFVMVLFCVVGLFFVKMVELGFFFLYFYCDLAVTILKKKRCRLSGVRILGKAWPNGSSGILQESHLTIVQHQDFH